MTKIVGRWRKIWGGAWGLNRKPAAEPEAYTVINLNGTVAKVEGLQYLVTSPALPQFALVRDWGRSLMLIALFANPALAEKVAQFLNAEAETARRFGSTASSPERPIWPMQPPRLPGSKGF